VTFVARLVNARGLVLTSQNAALVLTCGCNRANALPFYTECLEDMSLCTQKGKAYEV